MKTIADSQYTSLVYYINAFTGDVFKVLSNEREVQGYANVRHYSGSQIIGVKHRGLPNNDYYLKDESRNLHTKDYGSNGGVGFWLKAEVTDDDGDWESDDMYATSAHFFLRTAWDYFDVTFNRQGWDDHNNS